MQRLKERLYQLSHLFIPLSVLLLLIVINLIKGANYFSIAMVNGAFYGNIPNILFGASELVILSIGMTLVTAASQGQDIGIGASATITSAVFVWFVLIAGKVTLLTIVAGFLISCVAGLLVGAFNGTLVSIFKVQPMVATLILFMGGRSIAFMIDGKVSPILANNISNQIGTVIKFTIFETAFTIPIQTPIILTAVFIAIVAVVLKTTNLRLYVESVGINSSAARLNGINPKKIIFLTFLIMGVCTAVAGFIAVNKAGRHDSVNLLKFIMMDAILAVAIGGNSLSGGKFSITGSIIGAYTIEMLNRTLLRLEVEPAMIKAFKAVFIIILMVIASPVVRAFFKKGIDKARTIITGSLVHKKGVPNDTVVSNIDTSGKKEE